jgi:exodeoxyribonuclease VII large subunit
MPPDGTAILTVSQLTAQIKELLEGAWPVVWVVGEVSSCKRHSSGHVYMDLKDAQAAIKGIVWRSIAQRFPTLPNVGAEVIVRGRLNVYAPQGTYSLVIDQIHIKGAGTQDIALRKLKEKLAKLGYFASERKRPLPRFPRRLAVVSSLTGAAIRDMLEILRARWPAAEVWVLGVRVQGLGAPEAIVAAFELLERASGVDVVIIGRGGGSTDDLSAFNDERVATAIYRCQFPVISAVGHEIDVTIADLVADRRALTPSEAAVCATPDLVDILADLRARSNRMFDIVQTRVQAAHDRLLGLAQRRVFAQPLERLHERERSVDEWGDRLHRSMRQRVETAQRGIAGLAAQLESLSPLGVLARGYSLTRKLPDRRLVGSVSQVQAGDAVEIVLHDGEVSTRVEGIHAAHDP